MYSGGICCEFIPPWQHEGIKPFAVSVRFLHGTTYEQGKSKTERVIFLAGFSYKEQYAVVVICKDEKEQETIYNRLKAEGFKLKVVAV